MLASQPSPSILKAERFVRLQPAEQRVDSSLARRRSGAVAMACVGLATLVQRRLTYDSLLYLSIEFAICLSAIWLAGWFYRVRASAGRSSGQHLNIPTVALGCLAFAAPWVLNGIAKQAGAGNGMEIVMLGLLGWISLACAHWGTRSRTISLSVICSGFLALFATLISDAASATWFAYGWFALCLWWLVGNHWEGMEARSAERIDRSLGLRWSYIAMGAVLFAGCVLALGNRVPVWRKLQAELMPTSGGTSTADSAARSGVGNGDALIAAKNHASSFGAVETDIFLDSEKPSLFDLFSDEFGEPKITEKNEKAEALTPQEIQDNEGRFSEANRSSSESQFGIERKPPERKQPPNDLASNAIFFWQGSAHAHLAVQRFHRFDGSTWYASPSEEQEQEPAEESLVPQAVEIDGQNWFYERRNKFASSLSPYRDSLPEAAKFTRYGSPVIPSRCGTRLWSIDRIRRPDFFHYDQDDCLSMPGREQVPDYTVVRFVNGQIDLEKMQQLLQHCSPGKGHVRGAQSCQDHLAALAHRYTEGTSRGWDQVHAVIEGLRRDFVHHKYTEASAQQAELERFLQERQGPSYTFATATALMLEHLGYETRLVTGFYVNSQSYFAADDEYAVQPSDAHVWLEVNAGHGYWIPLEPTPGFVPPPYRASLWYRLVQARTEIAACLLGIGLSGATLYLLRAWIFDFCCWCCSPILVIFSDRLRVRWTAWVLDLRLALLGRRRPRGKVLRAHLADALDLPELLGDKVRRVLDAADGLLFGNSGGLTPEQRISFQELWRELTVARLRKVRKVGSSS